MQFVGNADLRSVAPYALSIIYCASLAPEGRYVYRKPNLRNPKAPAGRHVCSIVPRLTNKPMPKKNSLYQYSGETTGYGLAACQSFRDRGQGF